MDGRASPDSTNSLLLRDARAPRRVDCCTFPPGRFCELSLIDGGVR